MAATLVLLAGCGGGVQTRTTAAPGYGTNDASLQPALVGTRSPRAVVTILPHAALRSVPRSFFGLSTEYWAMPLFEHSMPEFERVLSMLTVPGDGPLVLRIGGDSADHAILDVNVGRLPRSIVELTPAWFRNTSEVVRAIGGRVILDLNLVIDLPSMAALWAQDAEAELPRASIIGFEIGNEPDLYNRSYWLSVYAPLRPDIRALPSAFTPALYTRLFQSYARVLARYAPHIPLVGPVVAYAASDPQWIADLLSAPHPGLGMVSGHEYPYSACATPISPVWPTIPRLLSEAATAGMAQSLRPAIMLAHDAGYPFRLTEVNSVTCGGVAGVSDRFVTALWAPDAMFELLRAGVDGANVHVRPYTINFAFGPAPHGLIPRPLLYGLITFIRTLGADPRVVDVQLRAPAVAALKVWAVRARGGVLHVLLINKGRQPVTADLRLPATGLGTVQRLLAPSAASPTGVTLDGQRLGPDMIWHGRAAGETIAPGRAGYPVRIPPTSAALVEVHVRPGALGT